MRIEIDRGVRSEMENHGLSTLERACCTNIGARPFNDESACSLLGIYGATTMKEWEEYYEWCEYHGLDPDKMEPWMYFDKKYCKAPNKRGRKRAIYDNHRNANKAVSEPELKRDYRSSTLFGYHYDYVPGVWKEYDNIIEDIDHICRYYKSVGLYKKIVYKDTTENGKRIFEPLFTIYSYTRLSHGRFGMRDMDVPWVNEALKEMIMDGRIEISKTIGRPAKA